jgi:hypothetical protein
VILLLVSAGLLYDRRTRGRPHWVLVSGSILLIASQVTRRLVGGSELWARVVADEQRHCVYEPA